MRSSLWSHRRAIAAMVIILIGGALLSLALADDESDRRSLLSDIDARLSSAYSELSGVRSDDSKAREVVDKYPGYVENFKRANAALRSMKIYQNANVTLMKACQDTKCAKCNMSALQAYGAQCHRPAHEVPTLQ